MMILGCDVKFEEEEEEEEEEKDVDVVVGEERTL